MLPSLGKEQVDAVAGFALCLLPAALPVWLIATRPFGGEALALGLAVGVLVAGATAGTLLGRQFLYRRWLLVGAVVALVVDLYSVFRGPTRLVVEHAPRTLDFLLVQFPSLGSDRAGFGLGVSDFLFLALFVAGSRRCGLHARASLAAMLAGVLATVVAAAILDRALPALPLLCLAFILVNADRFIRSDTTCHER